MTRGPTPISPVTGGIAERPAIFAARREIVLVVLLTLLAFALRFPSPDRQLEYDEVISMLFAQKSLAQMVQATAADTMPPLYYGMLHLWSPGAEDLFQVRLLSTLLGAATIPVFYLLARRLAVAATALAATALLAASPFHVFYGHYARMYALLALLGILATLFFIRWLQEGRRRDLALFAASAALSLYVHNLAFLLILGLDALFLAGYMRWPGDGVAKAKEVLVAHAALAMAFLPWLGFLPGQLEKVARAFWTTPPGPAELVRTAIVFHFHLPLPATLVGPVALVSLLLVVIIAVEARRRWLGHSEERAALLALGVLVVAPIALMFLVSQVRPVYVERAVMVSSAMYYLLLTTALRWLPIRPLAWGLGSLLATGIVLANLYQYSYQEFPRSPFREVAQYLRVELRPGDTVLHDNKLSYFPTFYFARDLPQGYVADIPGSPNDTLASGTIEVLGLYPTTPQEAVQGQQRLWLVVFRRALAEAEAAGATLSSKAWLDQRFSGQLQASIGDVELYLYRLEG